MESGVRIVPNLFITAPYINNGNLGLIVGDVGWRYISICRYLSIVCNINVDKFNLDEQKT